MRREACLKFNQNQVFRQRMCLGLKTEPAQWWRGDVQDGTGAGGAQCRARTLAPAHTGSALCPLVCPETWSAPDSSPAVPRPFLPPAAARPNATERQLISLFRAQALHPKHTGAAITLRVLGTKFSIPADSLQRRILLSRMDQFILLAKIHQWRLSTKPIIYFFLILYGNGGLKG